MLSMYSRPKYGMTILSPSTPSLYDMPSLSLKSSCFVFCSSLSLILMTIWIFGFVNLSSNQLLIWEHNCAGVEEVKIYALCLVSYLLDSVVSFHSSISAWHN